MKGQSGAGAANLILIIGAMILIYVLFLPSDERDELLDRDVDGVIRLDDDEFERVLLDEQPGTIVAQNERDFSHNLPSFILKTSEEDQVLRSIESVHIDNQNPTQIIPIYLDERPQSAIMTFQVADHSGILTVLLNDEQIFRGEVDGAIDPISIQLREENLIEFQVEGGSSWQFWKSDFYDIRDVRIVGTTLNKELQESVGTFFVSRDEAEAEDVRQAYVIYLVDCQTRKAGRMQVFLNGVLLSSKIPDCGELDQTFFDPGLLIEGRNELRFSTDEGTYLIDRIFIRTFLSEQRFPLYFFEINSTQLDALEDRRANASMRLRFINDDKRKEAVVRLNNHQISIDTRQGSVTRRIDPGFLVEQSNSVRIEPERTLDVLDFEIVLQCRDRDDCV